MGVVCIFDKPSGILVTVVECPEGVTTEECVRKYLHYAGLPESSEKFVWGSFSPVIPHKSLVAAAQPIA